MSAATSDASVQPPQKKPERIHSIDQFRGYTVLGMFVVNFLGHYKHAHYNFHHNDYFLSYADTIMPAFIFVVGISFRFTLLRRLASSSRLKTYAGYLRRSLALCLVSIVLNGVGQNFKTYKDFFVQPETQHVAQTDWNAVESGDAEWILPTHMKDHVWNWARLFAKSYLWETLAVIGIVQLVVLPFVHLPFWYRFSAMCALGLGHVFITDWFNWQFFYGYTLDGQYVDASAGLNNWMGQIWGTGSNRSWDGGIFGLMTWGFTMLAGTLCYDLMAGEASGLRIKNLLKWGVCFLLVGYALSCLQTLYDAPAGKADERISNTHGKDKGGFPFHLAATPVLPDWHAANGRPISSFLTEPPFVARPEGRLINYWMMSKRVVTLPFVLATSGFAFIGLALFVITADVVKLRIGIFRTFGMNALIAYVLHKMVLNGLMFPLIPKDAAAWMYWSGLAVFLIIVYRMVRGLEKQNVYIKM